MATTRLLFCITINAIVGSDATQAITITNARRNYQSASIGVIGNIQTVTTQARTASLPDAELNHPRNGKSNAIKLSTDGKNILETYVDSGRGRHLANHTMPQAEINPAGEFQVIFQPSGIGVLGAPQTMLQAEYSSQVMQDAHVQPAILTTYKALPAKKNTPARSAALFASLPLNNPIMFDGKTVGFDPSLTFGPANAPVAANGIDAVDLSTLASQMPNGTAGPMRADAVGTMTPRKKMWLISFVVLNTVGAASVYLAARLQSRAALVPNTGDGCKSQATVKCERKDNMRTKTSTSGASNSEPATNSASASSCVRGQCRGFASSMSWRDPTIDLQIGDRSLEDWAQRRRSEALVRLGGCAVMTAVILLLQILVALYIESLALIINAIHLLTDVAMYAGLFFAVHASTAVAIDPSYRNSYSYGLHRLEVVFVLIAMVIQYITTLNIAVTAARRIWHPVAIASEGGAVICATAIVSLAVNSCLAVWVSRTSNVHSHSHVHGGTATHMARMHLIFDAVQNGIVIVAGALIWIDPHLQNVDAICSFLFAFLVIVSTQGFFRQLLHIVMERAPEDLDCDQIFKSLEDTTDVLDVHCFHVWSISQGKLAMSVHLHVSKGTHEDVLQEVQTVLKHRYGIYHSTIQISDDEDLA